MYRSINIYAIMLLVLINLLACREPCLDMDVIEETTEEMQSWYTNSDIITKTASSSIGISDEVHLIHDFQNFGDTIWDDCGNASESERSTVTYDFFNFPFYLETVFNKQGEENGFKFTVRYNMYSASYKFTSETSSSYNTIEYLTAYQFNGTTYPEAFKVSFNQTQNDSEIKELVFIKDLGVIHIVLNSGATIDLE
ncbi:hypothetical protein [Winogradskyella flava]|uniref:hypothetical protein n=1 Tax=Winogradskyella flava TaxID=1884876 RepID=UPI0024907CFE|nr:hypothetical protein [Winogradskyella flava]